MLLGGREFFPMSSSLLVAYSILVGVGFVLAVIQAGFASHSDSFYRKISGDKRTARLRSALMINRGCMVFAFLAVLIAFAVADIAAILCLLTLMAVWACSDERFRGLSEAPSGSRRGLLGGDGTHTSV